MSQDVARDRRQDLLLSAVMLGLLLTPAWLTPAWFARPWLLVMLLLAAPALALSWWHAPWVPTPADETPRILAALAMQEGECFCDLGAGDGRLVAAVHRTTGVRSRGVEAMPLMYLLARWRLAGLAEATVELGDLYRADLGDVDAVYVWGTAYSVSTPGFREFLQSSLPSGARVVAYGRPLEGLEPVRTDRDGQRPLFCYVLA